MGISVLSTVNSVNTKHSMSLSGRGRSADLPHPDKRGYGADIYCQGIKALTYFGPGYGWACERTPAEREKEGNFTEFTLMSTVP